MVLRSLFGTLLYYLTAMLLGVIFLAAAFYLHARAHQNVAEDEPYHVAISLLPALLSIVPQLVSAFLLRRLARWLRWTRGWQWMLAGSVLTLAVLWGCGQAGLALETAHVSQQLQPFKIMLMVLLVGSMMATTKPFWLAIPGAALLALLLFLTHRKFASQAESAVN